LGLYDKALSEIRNEKATNELGPPDRVLTPQQKKHILKGEVKGKNIKGGHWRQGCVDNGFTIKITAVKGNGFYEGTLTHPDASEEKTSTFYPDDWTEDEIISVIQYAKKENPKQPYLITQTGRVKNIKLFDNGDSIFPYFK